MALFKYGFAIQKTNQTSAATFSKIKVMNYGFKTFSKFLPFSYTVNHILLRITNSLKSQDCMHIPTCTLKLITNHIQKLIRLSIYILQNTK